MRPVMTMKLIHDSNGRRLEGLDDDREGKFHGWGSGYEEFESGPGNYTVAIVEFPDGKIETVMPYFIRFLDGETARSEALDYALANPIICG